MPSSFTGADLRALRARLGVTQIELARLLGYSPSTVRAWEHGRRAIAVAVHQRLVMLTRQADKRQQALARSVSGLRAQRL